MADPTSLVVAAAVVLALVLAAIVSSALLNDGPRRRDERLRERFGPEYDIAIQQFGSRAVRVLEERERRVAELPLRSLAPAERASFAQSWLLAQRHFVDAPHDAVKNAHELVRRTMHSRGYPVDDFEQCAADLSVDYGSIVQHYRAAHALDEANRAGRANTEELRQALVHYRALFEELLGTPTEKVPPASQRYEPALARRMRPLGLRGALHTRAARRKATGSA